MDNFTQDDYITLKCRKCGNELGFFPMRVMYLYGCKCGNRNYGYPTRDWINNEFGDFDFIKKEILIFDLERSK